MYDNLAGMVSVYAIIAIDLAWMSVHIKINP